MRTRLLASFLLLGSVLLAACSTDGIKLDVDRDGGNVEPVDAQPGQPDGPPRPDATPDCGNGQLEFGEACDDGDEEALDGCSATCEVEPNFACPTPGMPCVQIVTCGNGRIEGDETCDDADLLGGDGCSATCQREPGWSCPLAGAACVAAECGDGIVAGFEQCDDGDAGAGCVNCRLQPGFHCPVPGQACQPTTCGDAMPQGLEECDDGNAIVGDGCTPACLREPSCVNGVCAKVCGDSVLQSGETCDDGNNFDGDGCSSQCQEEQGFSCVETELPDPAKVVIYATVRDFVASCGDGARLVEGAMGATAPFGHPDFQCFNGARQGMVATSLDNQKKPVRVANDKTTSDASFKQWYRSDQKVNRTIALEMTLNPLAGTPGAYRFDSNSFYPATGKGLDTVTCGGGKCEQLHADGNGAGQQNFHFTSELHFWFEYAGNETLAFSGDDDVWVFINGKLAVDIGGVHGREDGSVDLGNATVKANLGLQEGKIYEAIVFQAERHTERSQYRLTLTNFNQTPSTCTDDCGDGVISSREVCDDGDAGNGGTPYGGCAADCTLEPFCGDGVVQADFGETCDDGLNLGGSASSCAPGCQSMGGSCGDGVVQTDLGETCDDHNTDNGDGCSSTCRVEIG